MTSLAPATREPLLPPLARALVQAQRIKHAEAARLHARAARERTSFIDALLAGGLMSPAALARFCADTWGYPLFDLAGLDIDSLPATPVDAALIQAEKAIPVARHGKRLLVALADPTNQAVLDRIKLQTAATVEPVVVAHDALQALLGRLARRTAPALDVLAIDAAGAAPAMQAEPAASSGVDEAPLVRYLNQIVHDAVRMGASDIHFEPFEHSYRIRLRIDGVLHAHAAPPVALREQLVSRIKVLARLDIAERRLPQDGRMRLEVAGLGTVDFRVSTLPTLFGEKTVVRILDRSKARPGIDALGLEDAQKAALLAAVRRPGGMVLVTGPTGSGKTVTLYSCLQLLNQVGTNIVTAEDPAEIPLSGINQVSIHERAGLTFAAALRAFLRQDPDVIMVGEIRDLDTASIAVKAAQTGHLVLSTLHTLDAPSTLSRLVHMGVAPFNIASAVTLITAQRLVRRLCTCARPLPTPAAALLAAGFTEAMLDGGWQPLGPGGCEHCLGSGYRGRVAIHQVMPVTPAIAELILAHADASQLARQAAREHVATLREAGLAKVRAGITSLAEVLAATDGA